MAVGRSVLDEQNPRILPGLPHKNLSPEQQLEALRKVQAQAEQRVKLGMQLFKSAEARLAAHADLVSQVRNEQKSLRDKVGQDTTQRLATYDRKLEQMDDRLDAVVKALEGKIDAIAAEWRRTQGDIAHTRQRCEALLEQAQRLLDDGRADQPIATHPAPPPAPRPTASPAKPAAVTPLEALEEVEPAPELVQDEAPMAEEDAPPPIRMPSPEPVAEQPADADDEHIYSQILSRLRQQDPNAA